VRRAIVALLGTAAGTVLLVGAKTGLGQTAVAGDTPALVDGKQQPSGSASPAKQLPPSSGAPAAAPTSKAATGNGLRNGTFKGAVAETDYGNVQVSIVIAGGKITDVKVLAAPDDTTRSEQLSAQALPRLRQEALTAQSAKIDSVSGASSTSDGYRRSLQSAIDQARGA
jgi:uncharacterized protein with FMN-binding domain